MVKDMVAKTALAVFSFLMSLYFGAECAEWLMAALTRPLGLYFPSLTTGGDRSGKTMSNTSYSAIFRSART